MERIRKQRKTKRKGARKKIGTVQQKTKQKTIFWLMRMRQSKILYSFTWKFHQNLPALSESAFLANLETFWTVEPRKSING